MSAEMEQKKREVGGIFTLQKAAGYSCCSGPIVFTL